MLNNVALNEIKESIESQYKQLVRQSEILAEDLKIPVDDNFDPLDRLISERDASMSLMLCNRSRKLALALKSTLDRIHKGGFGKCAKCEESIDIRRLKVWPTAVLCINCQEAQDSRLTRTTQSEPIAWAAS